MWIALLTLFQRGGYFSNMYRCTYSNTSWCDRTPHQRPPVLGQPEWHAPTNIVANHTLNVLQETSYACTEKKEIRFKAFKRKFDRYSHTLTQQLKLNIEKWNFVCSENLPGFFSSKNVIKIVGTTLIFSVFVIKTLIVGTR